MKFILNGQNVAPDNIFDIGLASEYNKQPLNVELDTDRVRLPREGLKIVQDWITTNGLFQGIPAQVVTTDEDGNTTTLEYYADLYDPKNKPTFKTYSVELKLKRRGGKFNFFDRAKGTSFDLMAKKGVIFDTIDIPYVIIKNNSAEMALSLSISLYVLTKELIEQIQTLADLTAAILGASALNTYAIITLIIQAIVQVVIIGLLLFALLKMAQQFFELIYPNIRYFQACKVKELMKKGAEFLDFTFESNLLDSISGLTILPRPLVKEKESIWDHIENDLNFAFTKGYPTAKDEQVSTVLRTFEAMELMLNGRTMVQNHHVQFERCDFWATITQNTVRPALNIQGDRRNEYTYNTEEAWKRYFPSFETDNADIHTLDFFDPTVAEYSTEVLNIVNEDLAIVQGLDDVPIPFALGVRKNKLNWLENFAKGFFEVIDDVINAFGGTGNFTAQIDARIGVLQISQQFYGVPKLMYTINGKQPENYEDIIGATAIYNNYHAINEITQNGHKIFSDVPIRLKTSDFVSLLNNPFAEIDGAICEILTVKYFDEKSRAVISYKQPFDYATGFVEIIKVD